MLSHILARNVNEDRGPGSFPTVNIKRTSQILYPGINIGQPVPVQFCSLPESTAIIFYYDVYVIRVPDQLNRDLANPSGDSFRATTFTTPVTAVDMINVGGVLYLRSTDGVTGD